MRLSKKLSGDSKSKIMVVDDEQGCIDALELIFKKDGHAVKGFNNPDRAVQELKSDNTYDIIISDYFMEPTRGDEFIQQVRVFNKDVIIAILTGYKDKGIFDFPADLDIEIFFEKGDDFLELQKWVEERL